MLSTFLPTSGTDLTTIDFRDAAIDLVGGVRYAVLMRVPDVAVGEFDWLIDAPGTHAGGLIATRNNGGSWTLTSADALFETVMLGAPTSADDDGDGIPDECAPDCPADLDGSGDVGFPDLLTLLAHWGPCAPACPEDLNGDDDVGFPDLLTLLAHWGPCAG